MDCREQAYALAREQYAALGVDTEQALQKLIPIPRKQMLPEQCIIIAWLRALAVRQRARFRELLLQIQQSSAASPQPLKHSVSMALSMQ